MTETATQQIKPWWREPWPWILMAGPALAIVGCAITIVLALDGFNKEPVNDGGVRKGLLVIKEPVKTPAISADDTSVE